MYMNSLFDSQGRSIIMLKDLSFDEIQEYFKGLSGIQKIHYMTWQKHIVK